VVASVELECVAGAKLDVFLRRGNAPTSIQPQLLAVIDPDGGTLLLPAPRKSQGGARYEVRGIRIEQSGTHLLRLVAADAQQGVGPISWRWKQRVPRSARFVLD
jgi:hypothetical protein